MYRISICQMYACASIGRASYIWKTCIIINFIIRERQRHIIYIAWHVDKIDINIDIKTWESQICWLLTYRLLQEEHLDNARRRDDSSELSWLLEGLNIAVNQHYKHGMRYEIQN